jgi:hypothetical protein
MICLCERDMTCLDGKLGHCRVLAPHGGTKRQCLSLENQTHPSSFASDSTFTQLQSINFTLDLPYSPITNHNLTIMSEAPRVELSNTDLSDLAELSAPANQHSQPLPVNGSANQAPTQQTASDAKNSILECKVSGTQNASARSRDPTLKTNAI